MKAFLSLLAVVYFVHQASAVKYVVMRKNGDYRYALEAKTICSENYGDSLATSLQVADAMHKGLQYCECAFADSGTQTIAMYIVQSQCGKVRGSLSGNPSYAGPHKCEPTERYQGAWCITGHGPHFNIPYPIHMEQGSEPYELTYAQASQKCQAWGHRLATRTEVDYAFSLGMSRCACGWIDDRTVVYPQQYYDPNCGGRGVNTCNWGTTWNAWCAVSA